MSVTAVFVGMPGSGKTTVGKLVARYLHEPFADTDHLIEKAAGQSIPDIFTERGETGFRALEAEVVAQALTHREGILSLGGGAVLAPATREALRGHRVVLIDVARDVLLARLERSTNDRPLMRGDTAAKLEALYAEREPLYRECATDVVVSDGAEARRVARRVLTALGRADHAYLEAGAFDAVLGRELAWELPVAIDRATDIVILHEGEIPAGYREATAGHRLVERPLAPASALHEILEIQSLLELEGISRSGMVIAIGGAPTIATAAFATRAHAGGLPLLAVPTTLEAALEGAWTARRLGSQARLPFEPCEILLDLDLLAADGAGLAHAISHGFAREPALLALATAPRPNDADWLRALLDKAIAARAAGPHATQRAEEFFYGRTLAAAIAAVAPGTQPGTALAAGMLFAAGIAEGLGLAPHDWVRTHREALVAAGLPVNFAGLGRDSLEAAITDRARIDAPDPKMHRHTNRFMIVAGEAGPRVVNSVGGSALDAGFRALGL